MDAVGTARLAPTIPDDRVVATTVSRTAIRAAVEQEERPQLLLELIRGDDNDTVSVTWRRAELEQLLEQVTAEEVALLFDVGELEQALGDVAAHGFRERAAVLSVAIATTERVAGGTGLAIGSSAFASQRGPEAPTPA
jgi:hypothetical protein